MASIQIANNIRPVSYTHLDVYKRQVDELLQDMAEGKTLDDAETEYVKIFANMKDFELSLIHI